MKVLFDYGTGSGPEEVRSPTFKDCAAVEVEKAFLNPDEHAQVRTVIYDGVTYEDIAVIEIGPKEGKRSSVVQMQHDFGQGLYKRSITLYCAEKDMGGIKPEQNTRLSMNEKRGGTFFHKFRVAESTTEMGMYRLKLEEVDE
ncbi:hypothetical protein D1159_00170 [Pseudoflavonifractor sp. 524-17]|uniref:hypothetical protein n=1 Tax=Pseudoflavonifractor sp. 524-17 TaxID=2304577 RepID=UPI00137AEA85|nr:hypothetical protein [Pseudoflavonifractor sp. 524-17]NCE63027.1 hypothetical protein [Pseudoflavonifractor sp. 524-17]